MSVGGSPLPCEACEEEWTRHRKKWREATSEGADGVVAHTETLVVSDHPVCAARVATRVVIRSRRLWMTIGACIARTAPTLCCSACTRILPLFRFWDDHEFADDSFQDFHPITTRTRVCPRPRCAKLPIKRGASALALKRLLILSKIHCIRYRST